MRILALDWGTVRIGGAISDPEGNIAFPLEDFFHSKTAISEIKQLVDDKSVEKILIGLPKALSGGATESTKSVEKFAQELKKLNLPIEFFDERFSSKAAAATLSSIGIPQKDQRGRLDNLAAAQMLQTYLERKK